MVSTLDRTLPGFYFVSLECYILFVAGLFSCIFSFFFNCNNNQAC